MHLLASSNLPLGPSGFHRKRISCPVAHLTELSQSALGIRVSGVWLSPGPPPAALTSGRDVADWAQEGQYTSLLPHPGQAAK